ncbi:anti-sigma factor antagonist [Sabulibacter ruber]|uniref:anti-sigma factor antagonist n=1 Tax=Sabulibacter ruber TaxID=2811901 RepID=UPI001A964772|nr:anti-sigma factor antagonist [Sabulibacter ruber]
MQKILTDKTDAPGILLLQEDVDLADQQLIRSLEKINQSGKAFHLWVDCAGLKCLKTMGFCHFINQLLLLRHRAAHITLLNLSPQHQALLKLFNLNAFFTIVHDIKEIDQLVQAS